MVSSQLLFRSCIRSLNKGLKGYSHSSEYSLPEIKKEFQNYKGGHVTLKKDETTGIGEIYLSNPEKKNAVTGDMMIQLSDVIAELENWKTGKALILYTPGNTFCAGADLAMVQQICNSEGGMRLSVLMHDTLSRLLALPLISVALVKGKAIGGGAELAISCDFRLLSTTAEVQFVQTRMGVATGWGGGTRLVHLLGPSVALELLTSCRKLTAKEALDIGLANDLLNEEEDHLVQAKNWLGLRTQGATQVVQAMKRIVTGAMALPMDQSLAQERRVFASIWGGPAQKEALKKNIKHK